MTRLVIVGKMKPGTEERIAEAFAESDGTELPTVTGTRHRSLYSLDDLWVHVAELERFDPAAMASANQHPQFVRLTERLAAYTSPYLATWRSPRDAMAGCFYSWDAPLSVPAHRD